MDPGARHKAWLARGAWKEIRSAVGFSTCVAKTASALSERLKAVPKTAVSETSYLP